MKRIEAKEGSQPEITDWQAIDEAFLIPACNSVSFMAYGEFRSCIPTR
jgi:hypothetical protein